MRANLAPRLVYERPSAETRGETIDLRFRALLPEDDWAKLSPTVQRRFSKRLANGATAVYVGEVREMRLSRIGLLLTQLLRLVGGPLPTSLATGVPSIVTVTEDIKSGGQTWTRLYVRQNGFPQVIHSCKRFAGTTGLEEYIGFGIGMALTIGVVETALVFRSAGYFFQVGNWRMPLPSWLTPGQIIVSHKELESDQFLFTLDLVHPRFGPLVHQSAAFRESHP